MASLFPISHGAPQAHNSARARPPSPSLSIVTSTISGSTLSEFPIVVASGISPGAVHAEIGEAEIADPLGDNAQGGAESTVRRGKPASYHQRPGLPAREPSYRGAMRQSPVAIRDAEELDLVGR